MGYGDEVGRVNIPINGDEDLLEKVESAFSEYSYGAVDVDPCWHDNNIIVSSTELDTDSLREILIDNGVELSDSSNY